MKDNEDRRDTQGFLREKNRTLILMVAGLLLAIMSIVMLEWEVEQPTPVVAPAPLVPSEKKKEVALSLEVTDCQKISTKSDVPGQGFTEYSDYRRLAGYVHNKGTLAVKFVKVLAIWKDGDDKILQQQEIFAVGDKPLFPGDRISFEDSTRNYLVQKCSAKIVDWWVAEKQIKDEP